jgi:DNA-binding LytR/AlgR family response regulator
MTVLIIEDEPLAAERLENLLRKQDPEIRIAGRCDSVKQSVEWLKENPLPDLMFLDIQLGDGLSFDIFDQVVIDCPVIFTTAYDEYAIDAFRLNSLHYLLKPLKAQDLAAALMKYKTSPYSAGSNHMAALDKVQQQLTREYKKRFLVKSGLHIRTIPVEEVLYFFSMDKGTYGVLEGGKNVLLDYTLDDLEKLTDPSKFFRVNRRYLVGLNSIADIITYSNYRLKLVLRHSGDQENLVSRDRMQDFRSWLDR